MKLIDVDPTLATRSDLGSGVSNRARALGERTVSELSIGELAFCLRQGIAVPQVAERAVEVLVAQPLINAEAHPGDLLCSLLHGAAKGWLSTTVMAELFDICNIALAGAESIQESVVPAATEFLAHWHDTNNSYKDSPSSARN